MNPKKKYTRHLGILCCIAICGIALLSAGCVTGTDNPDEISEELSYFYEINQVPRPSGNTAAMQEYLISFAKNNGLPYEKDAVGNILIHHPGTSENTLILQGHQDMVPAVEEGYTFDFNTDSVTPVIDDGWISAKHTSLGADDGAGVSIILTALTNSELKDCTFSGLFTVDEETTMLGVFSLDPAWLNADGLLNIDSETARKVTISSAGGTKITAIFAPEERDVSKNTTWYQLTISGLLSGHSGNDIEKGRLNAILLGADFLSGLENVQISAMVGGTVNNAIPNKFEAIFTTTADPFDAAINWIDVNRVETDPDLAIAVEETGTPEKTYSAEFTRKFLNSLLAVPNGLLEQDGYGPVLSSNLGVLAKDNAKLRIECFTRSSINEKREAVVKEIGDIFREAGAEVTDSLLAYGWKETGETRLMQVTGNIYQKITGEPPVFGSIHGGLECGYFAVLNPELMIVAIGPTIRYPHSINERMKLDTFAELKTVTFEIVKEFCSSV